jgi:hypothetical protein
MGLIIINGGIGLKNGTFLTSCNCCCKKIVKASPCCTTLGIKDIYICSDIVSKLSNLTVIKVGDFCYTIDKSTEQDFSSELPVITSDSYFTVIGVGGCSSSDCTCENDCTEDYCNCWKKSAADCGDVTEPLQCCDCGQDYLLEFIDHIEEIETLTGRINPGLYWGVGTGGAGSCPVNSESLPIEIRLVFYYTELYYISCGRYTCLKRQRKEVFDYWVCDGYEGNPGTKEGMRHSSTIDDFCPSADVATTCGRLMRDFLSDRCPSYTSNDCNQHCNKCVTYIHWFNANNINCDYVATISQGCTSGLLSENWSSDLESNYFPDEPTLSVKGTVSGFRVANYVIHKLVDCVTPPCEPGGPCGEINPAPLLNFSITENSMYYPIIGAFGI